MIQSDAQLKILINQLMYLLKNNDSRSEVVKNFIQHYHDWDEFVDLAAVYILAAEEKSK